MHGWVTGTLLIASGLKLLFVAVCGVVFTVAELVSDSDDKLFESVVNNYSIHVLHKLLPAQSTHDYYLRDLMTALCVSELITTRCRAIAGRTARCRYKFRHNGIVHAVTVVQHGFLV